jgi:hypothetical protein
MADVERKVSVTSVWREVSVTSVGREVSVTSECEAKSVGHQGSNGHLIGQKSHWGTHRAKPQWGDLR